MTKPITIFRKTTGLNTLIDPVDIDHTKGVQELAVAADVEISDKGRLSRRKGYTSVSSGNFHSLFCDGGDCICVTGTSLSLVNSDYSTTAIATVTAGAKVNACQVNNRIYWLNGHEKGYVENKSNNSWVKGTYVGPNTYRTFVSPPIGTIVEYFNGRIYIAQGSALWISEPFNYNAFDLARGVIILSSNIRMIRPVDDGIFVSTEEDVFFLAGQGPDTFQQITVARYPAIEGTDTKFQGNLVFYKDGGATISKSGQKACMWLSEEGICAGFTGGGFANLTEKKLHGLPSGLTGSGLVHKGKYLGLIDP